MNKAQVCLTCDPEVLERGKQIYGNLSNAFEEFLRNSTTEKHSDKEELNILEEKFKIVDEDYQKNNLKRNSLLKRIEEKKQRLKEAELERLKRKEKELKQGDNCSICKYLFSDYNKEVEPFVVEGFQFKKVCQNCHKIKDFVALAKIMGNKDELL